MKIKGLNMPRKRVKPLDLVQAYLARNAEFIAMLEERTSGEVVYDNTVTAGMRKGLAIKDALRVAAEQHPGEALQWDETTINDIKAHYDYLLGHEDILAKVTALKK